MLNSSAAAEVLASKIGDGFAYTDSSEIELRIEPLSFRSFGEAAKSAAMSRVYRGVHFKNACVVGNEQGMKIGQLVVGKLKLKLINSLTSWVTFFLRF